MGKKLIVAQSVLWAAAIIASVLVGEHIFFSVILLPSLAYFSLQMLAEKDSACQKQ